MNDGSQIAGRLDELLAMAVENERDHIMLFLGAAIEGRWEAIDHLPVWRQVLWAMIHPNRFGQITAISHAIVAISKGEHLQDSPA